MMREPYFVTERPKIKVAEYCLTPMTWMEAIDYGCSKGLYVPNKRECEELGIFSFVWTSTALNYKEAYVNKIHTPQPMNQKRLVILIELIDKYKEL